MKPRGKLMTLYNMATKNSDKNSVRPQNKNLNPPMKKGETINPKGRPKGQRNYATIYREALQKIAEVNQQSPDEVENILVQSGLKKALKGDFNFYRDTMDRLHGKPQQKIDHTTDGEKIETAPAKVILELEEQLKKKLQG